MKGDVIVTKRVKTPQGLRYCPVVLSASIWSIRPCVSPTNRTGGGRRSLQRTRNPDSVESGRESIM